MVKLLGRLGTSETSRMGKLERSWNWLMIFATWIEEGIERQNILEPFKVLLVSFQCVVLVRFLGFHNVELFFSIGGQTPENTPQKTTH